MRNRKLIRPKSTRCKRNGHDWSGTRRIGTGNLRIGSIFGLASLIGDNITKTMYNNFFIYHLINTIETEVCCGTLLGIDLNDLV